MAIWYSQAIMSAANWIRIVFRPRLGCLLSLMGHVMMSSKWYTLRCWTCPTPLVGISSLSSWERPEPSASVRVSYKFCCHIFLVFVSSNSCLLLATLFSTLCWLYMQTSATWCRIKGNSNVKCFGFFFLLRSSVGSLHIVTIKLEFCGLFDEKVWRKGTNIAFQHNLGLHIAC